MSNFIDNCNSLSNLQFGFKKGTSTTDACLRLVSDLLLTFNKKKFTIALFIDLRKAFDLVDRDILVEKLQIYGFRGIVNLFLKSYLSNIERNMLKLIMVILKFL